MARNNSSYRKVLFFCLLFSAIIAMAKTEKRVALIWGNSEYDGWTDLPQCTHDADTIADRLWKLGFDTLMLKNGNKFEMEKSLLRFQHKITNGADIAVFFYSGHAFNDGAYYLVPSKTELDQGNRFPPHYFSANDVFRIMRKYSDLSLLFFDACRVGEGGGDLEKERGGIKGAMSIPRNIGQKNNQLEKPKGYGIFYATRDDNVARTGGGDMSIFSRVFANHIMDDGEFTNVCNTIKDAVSDITNEGQRPQLIQDYNNMFFFNPAKIGDMGFGVIDSAKLFKEQIEMYRAENEALKARLELSNLKLERYERETNELAYSQAKDLSGETTGTQEDWSAIKQTEWDAEYKNALETSKKKEDEMQLRILKAEADAKARERARAEQEIEFKRTTQKAYENIPPSKPNKSQALVDGNELFGIDISKYQGNIDWEELHNKHKNIEFVYITRVRDNIRSMYVT